MIYNTAVIILLFIVDGINFLPTKRKETLFLQDCYNLLIHQITPGTASDNKVFK